ncbi:hypothetical protein Ahy_A08g040286 [Arachis hypogaea]|uniref:Uncharacterized protein n=1 Tax=Arachis hypogaea TaxID=3818 RepID=A0A445BYR2_ARAHY|nr:hypothetical protein Ahy_A08g040286 [Arachis hypogaea]
MKIKLMALWEVDVAKVANVHPFEEPSFMYTLDLETMYTPKFSEYTNAGIRAFYYSGWLKMEFSIRGAVITSIKDYTICRGYRLSEVSIVYKKYCWEINRYNGSHTCTRAIISQDYSKLDSNTIAEAIKSLVDADPFINSLILEKLLSNGKNF